MPSDSGADDSERSIGSTVAEETTRIEAVHYLEGASGHAVSSLVLLLLATVLFVLEQSGVAMVMVLVAYGVTANGLSIYIWDELRRIFEAAFESDDGSPTRTLRPHHVSPEMKAEVAAGAVMVGGLCVVLVAALSLFRTFGLNRSALIATSGLAVGNFGALGWLYLRS